MPQQSCNSLGTLCTPKTRTLITFVGASVFFVLIVLTSDVKEIEGVANGFGVSHHTARATGALCVLFFDAVMGVILAITLRGQTDREPMRDPRSVPDLYVYFMAFFTYHATLAGLDVKSLNEQGQDQDTVFMYGAYLAEGCGAVISGAFLLRYIDYNGGTKSWREYFIHLWFFLKFLRFLLFPFLETSRQEKFSENLSESTMFLQRIIVALATDYLLKVVDMLLCGNTQDPQPPVDSNQEIDRPRKSLFQYQEIDRSSSKEKDLIDRLVLILPTYFLPGTIMALYLESDDEENSACEIGYIAGVILGAATIFTCLVSVLYHRRLSWSDNEVHWEQLGVTRFKIVATGCGNVIGNLILLVNLVTDNCIQGSIFLAISGFSSFVLVMFVHFIPETEYRFSRWFYAALASLQLQWLIADTVVKASGVTNAGDDTLARLADCVIPITIVFRKYSVLILLEYFRSSHRCSSNQRSNRAGGERNNQDQDHGRSGNHAESIEAGRSSTAKEE
eukprot:gb/GECG01010457.1/.p1 GENE.gb/GECG01010457.1/~~gb/GECG01010457.1/.p1  ORF type:complete len:505 (+),score=36.37 gb/GECG01010457.1/:1-1515(+)